MLIKENLLPTLCIVCKLLYSFYKAVERINLREFNMLEGLKKIYIPSLTLGSRSRMYLKKQELTTVK